MIQKEKYLAPQIEIIKMENEGVIATSGCQVLVMVEMHTVVVLVPQEVIMVLAVVIWKT